MTVEFHNAIKQIQNFNFVTFLVILTFIKSLR